MTCADLPAVHATGRSAPRPCAAHAILQRDFPGAPSPESARGLLHEIGLDTTIRVPRRVDAPLALYGAGNLGRMAREYLDRLGIPIQFVIDAGAERLRLDPYWAGMQILAPEEVGQDLRQRVLLALCVVTSPLAPLVAGLTGAGWRDVVPFYDVAEAYRDRHPLSNGWFAAPFSAPERDAMGTVLDGWSDDISRAHHLQFIAWRRLRQEWNFAGAEITVADRFFIPEVLQVLTPDESFADVGAHLGSVTQRFLEAVDGRFRQIWAIDADPDSIALLRSRVASLPREQQGRIHVMAALIHRDASRRRFCSGLGYASQCASMGGTILRSMTLDTLDIAPTFIKLHLEGHELDALAGATRTLRVASPILTVTSYHNDLGLWRMPQWLMQFLGQERYRFYLRLHSWGGTGAVIYCIPRTRSQGPRARPGAPGDHEVLQERSDG